MTLFGLRANQETLRGRALCNHLADLPRRAPGARLGFAGNPAAPGATLHRALGAVCGARRGYSGERGPGEETGGDGEESN